jgi:hypothetical protein
MGITTAIGGAWTVIAIAKYSLQLIEIFISGGTLVRQYSSNTFND